MPCCLQVHYVLFCHACRLVCVNPISVCRTIVLSDHGCMSFCYAVTQHHHQDPKGTVVEGYSLCCHENCRVHTCIPDVTTVLQKLTYGGR